LLLPVHRFLDPRDCLAIASGYLRAAGPQNDEPVADVQVAISVVTSTKIDDHYCTDTA
jgi:phosphoglucomutase